jgi:hypothetical protein
MDRRRMESAPRCRVRPIALSILFGCCAAWAPARAEEQQPVPDSLVPPVPPPPAVAAPADAAPAEPKAPVPPPAVCDEALKLVKDIFRAEYAKSRPDDKAALAAQLLQQARESNEATPSRYVLLTEALRLAADGGEVDTARQACEELDRAFAGMPASVKLAALERLQKSIRFPEGHEGLADAARLAAEGAVEAEDWDAALNLLGIADRSARAARNAAQIAHLVERQKQVREMNVEIPKLKAAVDKLKMAPEDKTASLAAGLYYAVYRGDWEKAFPLLARGDDSTWAELARKELAPEGTAEFRIALGDRWWDAAEKLAGRAKAAAQRRAAHWYELALPHGSGLTRARLEKRLEEVAAAAIASGHSPVMPAGTSIPIAADGAVLWGYRLGPFPKAKEPDPKLVLRFLFSARAGDAFQGRKIEPDLVTGKSCPDASSFFYLFVIHSPERQQAELKAEADDWVRWASCNEKEIPVLAKAAPVAGAVSLHAGLNHVVIEAGNDGGPSFVKISLKGKGLKQVLPPAFRCTGDLTRSALAARVQWHPLSSSGALDSAVQLGPFPKDQMPEFSKVISFLMTCRLGDKYGSQAVQPVSAKEGRFTDMPAGKSYLYLFLLDSPTSQKAQVTIAADDFSRIAFLNGIPFVNAAAIELRQGPNAILVDAGNDGGPSYLIVRVSAAGLRQGQVTIAPR